MVYCPIHLARPLALPLVERVEVGTAVVEVCHTSGAHRVVVSRVDLRVSNDLEVVAERESTPSTTRRHKGFRHQSLATLYSSRET